MGSIHFITRQVKLSECPRCHVAMWIGIAEGLPLRVDPIPITVQGEIVARMQGRWTYGWNHGLRQCYYRDEYRMRKTPRPAVFATHACGRVLYAHMDVKWVPDISQVMTSMQRNPDAAATKEDGALFSLNEVLHTKVIEEIPF